MTKKVRVRFAPSPTGPLHMGGVRTALFNYLFAKKQGGDFILRIEDTDSSRYVPEAEAYIIEALNWCGICFDEGVSVGGPHEPYRQSERKLIYRQYAEQLVASGHAYYAFDTSAELDALRAECEKEGKAFTYNYEVRNRLKTSLVMPEEEVKRRLQEEKHWVVRFKIPENETLFFSDIIRGNLEVNSSTLDDKVLYKATDELPTYHLANIVDDKLMEITHVIRGEEWLPSLPLHVLLYRAFGWESEMPQFAHLSLLLKPDGKGKLSKRDGDRLGFPVFPIEWKPASGESARGYREDGYFPEAFVNLLALLGWNPGTEQEIFSIDELVEAFDLDRVIKSGARFNPDKAKWFNQQYLRAKDNKELALLYEIEAQNNKIQGFADFFNNNPQIDKTCYLTTICGMIKERATFVADFWGLSRYFFEAPTGYDEKVTKKYWKEETPALMQQLSNQLNNIEPFTKENTEQLIHDWITANELSMGGVMNAFRLCVVGAAMGPSMFEIIALLGKAETLKRIETAVKTLSSI